MIHSLYEIYKSPEAELTFELNIDVDQDIFEPELAVPLGLIVNEIACNSFKYAFEDNGLFYLNLGQDDENYTMIIGDNGKGIQTETKRESLGMSLIEILCDQIEADLVINNSDDGLEYQIKFKKRPQA
jgi:two-component sensor histidine kinase